MVEEDKISRFASALGLQPQELDFLHEQPAEMQSAIIDTFDASGSKDGKVLSRLQSYARHMAKRNSVGSQLRNNGAGSQSSISAAAEVVGGATCRYTREFLMTFWEKLRLHPPAEPPLKILSARRKSSLSTTDAKGSVGVPPPASPKATRSAPPAEAPPPPPSMPPPAAPSLPADAAIDATPAPPPSSPSSPPAAPAPLASKAPLAQKVARPAALGDAIDDNNSPRGKAIGFNVDAPEFVPFMQATSPAAAKQPRTPLSLAVTIAEPEELMSPPPLSPAIGSLQPGVRLLGMATLSSPAASGPPRTPVSLANTIAEPESPMRLAPTLIQGPHTPVAPPSEAPSLSRIKTAPAAPAHPPEPPGKPQNSMEYHLHRLLFMVVAKCSHGAGEATSEPQGVLLRNLRDEWVKVYGSDVGALMEKFGYTEMEALVMAVDGLRIEGAHADARVCTTRTTFDTTIKADSPVLAPAPSPAGGSATSQRMRPPPPPPVAPAPVLTPSGAKVLSLDSFVQSPSAKVPFDPTGMSTWATNGAAGYSGTPAARWGNMGGWPCDAPPHAPQWQFPGFSSPYSLPPPHDAPEPPSSSAL